MKKILVIGSIYTELVTYVDKLPKGNENFDLSDYAMRINGGAFISSYLFKGMNFDYELCTTIGSGVYGEFVKDELNKNGIEVDINSDQLNGCVYTMIDKDGQEGYFRVNGCEYNFNGDIASYINVDEISDVVLFGDVLIGENGEDVIGFLDDLNKPIFFMPGNYMDEIDGNVLEALFALNPRIYLSDTQAYYLIGEQVKDLKDASDIIYEYVNNDVFIFKEEDSIYYRGEDDRYLIPLRRKINMNIQMCAFVLGVYAGLELKKALVYANEFADECGSKLPSKNVFDYEKVKLVEAVKNA